MTPDEVIAHLITKFQSDIANLEGNRDSVIRSNEEYIKGFNAQIADIQSLIASLEAVQFNK